MPEPAGARATSATISATCVTVGIVAGILEDAGAGVVFAELGKSQREARRAAPRQAQQNRVRETTGEKRREGGARARRGAGAGRPAAPQRSAVLASHAPILAKPPAMTTLGHWP